MRHKLAAAAAGGLVLAVLWAAPALANVEEIGVCVAEELEVPEEDVTVLEEEGGEVEVPAQAADAEHLGEIVETCHVTANPILPAKGELIWGILSFAVLFFLLRRFAFPAVKQAMKDRTERIRSEIEAAEKAKTDAESVKEDYERRLADAKNEAGRIMEEARQDADAYRNQQREAVEAEIGEMRERARAEIEASKNQALADLRGEVADIALAAAEQVVEQSLDRDTNVALVERYIDQLAGTNGANGSNGG